MDGCFAKHSGYFDKVVISETVLEYVDILFHNFDERFDLTIYQNGTYFKRLRTQIVKMLRQGFGINSEKAVAANSFC